MNTTATQAPASKRPRKLDREPPSEDSVANGPSAAPPASAQAENQSQSQPQSKASLLLQMLKREEGATLDQMVAATGWLPHTTRAALTGLKKKGHEVTSTKADGVRTYRVTMPIDGSSNASPAEGDAAV